MTQHIVYATDDNYVCQLGVSLSSLLEHNSHLQFNIYILDNGITEGNKIWLNKISNNEKTILSFIDISNIETLLPTKVDVNRLTLSTYARLFLTDLLPTTVDSVLYIDCDTYINDSLADLLNTDISNYEVAGVEDCMYPLYKEGIGLKTCDRYMNAGILLINLKKWREENLQEVFMNFIMKFDGNVPHLDQGVINGTIKNRLILPLRYNVQSTIYSFNKYKDMLKFFSMNSFYDEAEMIEARRNPAIIHYTSFFLQRPWFDFCLHPKRNLYRSTSKRLNDNNKLSPNRLSFLSKIKCLLFKYVQPIYLRLR